jgi:hypothetical protein
MQFAKLGAERFATPFSQDSFIPCFMPVYPAHYIGDLALVEFGGLVKISGLPIIPSARPGASTLGLGRLTPDCSSQAA